MKLFYGMIIIAQVFLIGQAHAQDFTTNTGLILKNNTSVRAEGMGEAQAALEVDEAGALAFNPAGLWGTRSQGIAMVYYRGFFDENYGSLSVDTPVGNDWVLGGGLLFYDGGMFEWNTADGSSSQVPAERTVVAALSTAYAVSCQDYPIALGMNIKSLYSNLLNRYSAWSAAVDIGARMELKGMFKNIALGLAAKNIGLPMKYITATESLPVYGLGSIAYSTPRNHRLDLLLDLDTQCDLNRGWSGHVGAECTLYDCLAMRAGYRQEANTNTWNAGVGFTLERVQFDYAFSLLAGLNATHRLGMKYFLGYEAPSRKVVQRSEPLRPEATAAREDGEKMIAKITALEKIGGRIAKLRLNQGTAGNIKVGLRGAIIDLNGRPIAGVIVRQVEANQSFAEVIGLSQEITLNSVVLLEKNKNE